MNPVREDHLRVNDKSRKRPPYHVECWYIHRAYLHPGIASRSFPTCKSRLLVMAVTAFRQIH